MSIHNCFPYFLRSSFEIIGPEAHGFGGIRWRQTLSFHGGGEGAFSTSPNRRGRQRGVQHAGPVSGIPPGEGVCRRSHVQEWRAQDDGGLGIRQAAEEWESVRILRHVADRSRERRGEGVDPVRERGVGRPRDGTRSE